MTKTIRLSDEYHEFIKSHNREGETMSEAIERLIGGTSILDLYGIVADEDVATMREAIETSDAKGRERIDELRDTARHRTE